MKKILATVLLAISLNVTAFWNNAPWNGGYQNNGFIAQNPFSTFSPDWFKEEMDDFVDEFNNNNNNNSWNNRGYRNGPWNNGNTNNNKPWNNNHNNNTMRPLHK